MLSKPVGLDTRRQAAVLGVRQNFVRDGWEVVDTPPLTNRGKTSADTHIVMDVLDAVAQYPHVDEYIIMAADADYTPLVIRLRKHMKKSVVYAAAATSVAYRAACDSTIDEEDLIAILSADVGEPAAAVVAGAPKGPEPIIVQDHATPEKVAARVERYFAESGIEHRANVSALGSMLNREFDGLSKNWLNYKTLSLLLRQLCGLKVEQIEGRTLAWKESSNTNSEENIPS